MSPFSTGWCHWPGIKWPRHFSTGPKHQLVLKWRYNPVLNDFREHQNLEPVLNGPPRPFSTGTNTQGWIASFLVVGGGNGSFVQLALVTDAWTQTHTSVTQLQRDQLQRNPAWWCHACDGPCTCPLHACINELCMLWTAGVWFLKKKYYLHS